MRDWMKYRAESREPVIIGPRGNLTNHHWLPDGSIGRRVKPEEATHTVVNITTVEAA